MSQIPPISQIRSSSSPSPGEEVQTILNRHCKDYPKTVSVGCNLVVMRENTPPVPLHAGTISPNGAQNWGSTSKQFTAACIDQLVKQGKLNYSDDIHTLCPDLPLLKLNGVVQKVTVDDCLHMRSGLPEVWAIALITGVDAELLNNAQLLDLLRKHPGMVFPPGSKQMYCNTNYYVLAKIVEDVSGCSFVDYVRESVLVPMKMQARCSTDPSCPESIPGYDGDPLSKTYMQKVTSPNCSYGATGLIGPPSDMIPWNEAIAKREFDLLEPPKGVEGRPEDLYCRGLIVGQLGDYLRIYHGGMLAGAVTIYRRYEHPNPSKTFAFFLATNADSVPKAEKIANDVANALAGTEIEKAKHAPDSPLADNRKSDAEVFSGTYRCEELGTEWVVEPKEKEPGKWAVHMIPTDYREFPRLDFDPKRNKDGHLVFQSGYGDGTLEKTAHGFVYNPGIMASLHFTHLQA